jgi:hypothetical protein
MNLFNTGNQYYIFTLNIEILCRTKQSERSRKKKRRQKPSETRLLHVKNKKVNLDGRDKRHMRTLGISCIKQPFPFSPSIIFMASQVHLLATHNNNNHRIKQHANTYNTHHSPDKNSFTIIKLCCRVATIFIRLRTQKIDAAAVAAPYCIYCTVLNLVKRTLKL